MWNPVQIITSVNEIGICYLVVDLYQPEFFENIGKGRVYFRKYQFRTNSEAVNFREKLLISHQ